MKFILRKLLQFFVPSFLKDRNVRVTKKYNLRKCEEDVRDYKPRLMALLLPVKCVLNRPPIRSQGSINSCASHAAVRAEEIQLLNKGKFLEGSELFHYYVVRKEINNSFPADDGMSMRDACKGLSLYGMSIEYACPYDTKNFNVSPKWFAYSVANLFQLRQYEVLSNLSEIKGSLVQGVPVLCGIEVDAGFEKLKGKGCVWKPKGPFLGGHAQCCHPDTVVTTNNGLKKITELNGAELVLTREGFKKINYLTKNYVKENLYKIKTGLYPEPLIVTGNHPVLSQKTKRFHKWSYPLNLDFINAEELQKRNIISSVVDDKVIDNKDITSDVMRLFGYYFGDGNIQYTFSPKGKIKSAKLRLTYSRENKKKIEEDFIRIIKQIDPKVNHSIYEYKNSNTNILSVYSTEIAKFVAFYCGDANNKKLDSSLLKLPLNKQIEFLRGWFLTDGNGEWLSSHCKITCNSLQMIDDLIILLQRLRLNYSFIKVEGGNKEFYNGNYLCKSYYNIHFNNLKDKTRMKYEGSSVLTKIKKIEKMDYEGYVYNLEVEGKQEFLANNVLTHNCIVGYDDNDNTFLVDNSWGSGWGDKGSYKVGYSDLMGNAFDFFRVVVK